MRKQYRITFISATFHRIGRKIFSIVVSVPILAAGCIPVQDNRQIAEIDLHPPVLEKTVNQDPTHLLLRFNKDPELIPDTLSITPSIGIDSVTAGNKAVKIQFSEEQQLGTLYTLSAAVKDSRGNSMNFLVPFYGFNPVIPGITINEFTTQGSGNHPDVMELYVRSAGNLAGITVYEGTKTDWDNKIVLPPAAVQAGDYILIHFKPQGITGEVDETESIAASGGLDASDTARDFWVPKGTGLSGNNGVLTVYNNPTGDLIDGVLYSNRTSGSDEKYRGFGSTSMMEKADELVAEGGWITAGDQAAPEDAVNPEDSTATRSMCRNSHSTDTDCKIDWHIVPTSTYSFGTVNSDEIYKP